MSIPAVCPRCQTSLQLPDRLRGKEINCIGCGHTFLVLPAAQSAMDVNPPPIEPRAIQEKSRPAGAFRGDPVHASPAPLASTPSASKSSTAWIWLLAGGGLVAATMCLGVGGLAGYWFLRPMAKPPRPAEAVVAEPLVAVAPAAPVLTEAVKPVEPIPIVPGPAGDTIPQATLQAIKHATVFIKAETTAASASGSGFVVQVQGETAYIATNHHVIASHTVERPTTRPINPRSRIHPVFPSQVVRLRPTLTLVFGSGTPQERSARAEVVADDADKDLAILKVTGVKDLPRPIDLNQPPQLVETMPVYTFGFPFGKFLATNKGNPAITVGKGSISSVRLDEHGQLSVVQIDGALNPGNSGGPVVDTQGRLVGVAVATIKGSTGIGLAIPPQELGKVLSGRVASITLARRKRNAGNTELLGEIWMVNSRNQIATSVARTVQVAAPGQPADVRADQEAEVVVEVQFLDPLHKIQEARIAYLRGDRVKNPAQMDRHDSWTPLPEARFTDLQRDEQLGQATLQLATAPAADEYFFQVAYRLADGRTISTQPRSFRLNRASVAAPAPVPPEQAKPDTPAPQPPKKKQYTDEELTLLLADLKSTDFFRCKGAVERLRDTEPTEKRRSEVARALETALDHNNVFVRRLSVQALGVWGDANTTTVLVKRIGPVEKDIFLKQFVIESLGQLKNEKATGPVVACLADFFLRERAIKALRLMGVVAEPALIQALEHREVKVRIDACHLLKEFGTKASLPALELARKDSHVDFSQAAGDAWQAIQERAGKT